MNMYKRYLPVIQRVSKQGDIKPLYIIWDNQLYKIDKIFYVKKAASQVGGCGILYECMIDGKRRKLFYEKDRWFIESFVP